MSGLTPAPKGYPIKLVRDNTAEIINRSGVPGDLWYGTVDDETALPFLKQKLGEEVAEYLVHGGPDELADVYAVVLALADLMGIEDIDRIFRDDPRGGFFECQMMFGRHEEFDTRSEGPDTAVATPASGGGAGPGSEEGAR